ncbi:MAG TPA: glutamine--tRNA ligase, partial [Saprospiraceae bacterium]|nr:glutamine--tRNA ligase [Saprospiraceae bacterium]
LEKITHSICTLEFLPHRPLYNWLIKQLEIFPSRQIEFARLNLSYAMMSKRKLLAYVNDGIVYGCDDPRMLTISGLRRRGYTPSSIREFAHRIGIAKRDNMIDMALLEFVIREELNRIAMRVMVVTHPIKVTITNYPEGKEELLSIINNPEDESAGSREVPFSKNLYIEQEDFMENPPKKWFRLSPGGKARLKGAYIIQCDEVIKDSDGQVTELKCTYFHDSKSGQDQSGIKVRGVLHWVSAPHAYEGEVRLYDRLFKVENVGASDLPTEEIINPDSLIVVPNAKMEPALKNASPDTYYQFMRKGYFCIDPDSTDDKKVFNRTVTLKDGWKRKSTK